MTALALAAAGFAGMELVSYAVHRWVMHGVGMAWHRSHHQPPQGRFERNDRFPLLFAGVGIALFALGAGPWPPLWWVATGVTAYGVLYLVVHELFIHRRLAVPLPRWRYLAWLREAHRDHHTAGGEPYGMLLPLRRDRRHPISTRDPLERRPPVRSTRAMPAHPLDARPVEALDGDEGRVDRDGVAQHRH